MVVPAATVRIPGPAAVPAEAKIGKGPVGKKDSVELLLDGIAGPRPDRTKTTPQTGGEASAAYHAEHSVHPGHRPHEDAPKVLVDRPSTPEPIPLSTTAAAARRAPTFTGLAHPLRDAAFESTVVTPRDLRRRVLLAAVAGLLVVLGVFVVLQLTAPRAEIPVLAGTGVQAQPPRPVAAPPPPPPVAEPSVTEPSLTAAAPEPTAAPHGDAPAVTAVAPPPAAVASPRAPAAAAAAAPVRAAASSRNHKSPKASTPPAPAPAPSADLGEFKVTF